MRQASIRAGRRRAIQTANINQLSELGVRERLRGMFTDDPMLKDKYYKWVKRYTEEKSTYDADFRAVLKGSGRSRQE